MASDYPFVILKLFLVNKGHNSVNIIGNSTPHLSPLIIFLDAMWQHQQRKKKGANEEI